MGRAVEVGKEQLIEIIKGIEARGEDASELRRQLESLSAPTKPMARVTRAPLRARKVSDEEYVQALRDQSKIQKGKDLICVVCKKKANNLISDVCEECFWDWALSTKKEE